MKPPQGAKHSLDVYNAKRDFDITPEPSGVRAKPSKQLRFVVQMHHATRLHYDFRLEADGVLASWAVPKGPTLVPLDRRLAMHVEDHPMNYRDFEGTIPRGQYGAGSVIVWDNGTYELFEGTDAMAEINNGKIKFIMHGEKLRGLFTLVRIKPKEGETGDPWLLFKDKDEFSRAQWDVKDHPQSVISGKTLKEVAENPLSKTWQSKPKASAKPKPAVRSKVREPIPEPKALMLATSVDAPFDNKDWLFEIKWDGYRALCTIADDGTVKLVSRNGLDLLKRFPELSDLRGSFKSIPIVVDGEIVSLDEGGRSSFQRLQDYEDDPQPLTFVAFDLLYADGKDVRKQALEERKALLERLIEPDDGLVMYSKHIVGSGKALFAQAQIQELEGVIGKRRTSTYQERRTTDWVKIKSVHEQEFVIGGWTQPKGSRKGFGALLLGVYDGKNLNFAGSVGTGFTSKTIAAIHAQLKEIPRATSPFASEIVVNSDPHFVKPTLVAQVRFSEWTRDGYLRHPVFIGMRSDKKAGSVTRER